MSFVDTKPVQRLFSLYCDGPVPSQDELGKALDTMEGMVALATLVFLPGEFHGERSLVGYSPWGHKELDTTERLYFQCLNNAFWIFVLIPLNATCGIFVPDQRSSLEPLEWEH